MKAIRFEHRSRLPVTADELWRFHTRPDALRTLTPRLLPFSVTDPGDGVAEGSVARARVGAWPLRSEWHALHAAVEPGRGFSDLAIRSPFPYWLHQHRFEPLPAGGSCLVDVVWFVPPRWMPQAVARGPMRWALRALFLWRHRVTARRLARHRRPAACGGVLRRPFALDASRTPCGG